MNEWGWNIQLGRSTFTFMIDTSNLVEISYISTCKAIDGLDMYKRIGISDED